MNGEDRNGMRRRWKMVGDESGGANSNEVGVVRVGNG